MSRTSKSGRRPIGRSNPLVGLIRSLQKSPEERARHGLMLVEGIRLAEEALAQQAPVREAIVGPRLGRDPRGRDLLSRIDAAVPRVFEAGDALLASLHDAETHQGVLLVVERPGAAPDDLIPSAGVGATVLVACGVQDPGNMGTLVRLVDASSASGLLAAGGADPFGPKAVRASAGSIFRVPVCRIAAAAGALAAAERLRARGLALVAAVPRGGIDYRNAGLSRPAAIFLGGEGPGLPEDVLRAMDVRASIPIHPRVESINVASAAAVLLFEALAGRGLTTRPPAARGAAAARRRSGGGPAPTGG